MAGVLEVMGDERVGPEAETVRRILTLHRKLAYVRWVKDHRPR
jgi:hypothetical protein